MGRDDRILVTGVRGQLGFDVCRELARRGYENVRGIDIEELDITDERAVHAYVRDFKPDRVFHNAAWTAVDRAEEYPEKVYAVNALGPKHIAEACSEVGASMVYISTDYVFPGDGDAFYREEDPKGPLGVYGRTKLQGEEFVASALERRFTVRISWVFGINGNNFVKTMLRLAETKRELSVVCDQIGSPTYTLDLARLLCDMSETEKYGVYHATNEGICSWHEFAEYIFEAAGLCVKARPVTTEEYQAMVKQAARPLNSRMSKEKLRANGFEPLPDWHDAVSRYIHGELKR